MTDFLTPSEQGPGEPEIEIKLTSLSIRSCNEVQYDFKSGQYEPVTNEDLIEDLLTLPSRIIHKDDLALQKMADSSVEKEDTGTGGDVSAGELEELYDGVLSKEELAKLDTQPNPFNFSERVSQTIRIPTQNLSIQTEPPPSTTFSVNVGLSDIYDAYQKDYEKLQEIEREKEKEKEREKERANSKGKQSPRSEQPAAPPPPATVFSYGDEQHNLDCMATSARIMERMVNQNIYDDITQDFKYWEDGSDEFRPLEGSLLPLWKFNYDKSRSLVVSALCWSPIYPDLFAAAYTTGDIGGPEGDGMLCLYTLKNPATPERAFCTPCGVTTLQFHPKLGSVVVAGWSDGAVAVYDARSPTTPTVISSTTMTGKHLLPVSQVCWIHTEPGEDLCFYSVSLDGRLTQWLVHASALVHTDVLDFNLHAQPTTPSPASSKVTLEGVGTCVAFRPDDSSVFLVGCDTGAVFQCSTAATTHALTRYPAHSAPVRDLAWNTYHHKVFVSCSIDWTLKIWLQYHLSPLIVLDLGGPVASVSWSPFSSSVFVAVTDEGRVHVYDLFLRKCRPLCVQNIVQRRRVALTSVAFNPFFPMILVGGEKGHLVSLKLSPNLRKPHKDAKGADEQKIRDIELCKMDRLIAISRG